jgi:hypothetical protein
MRLFRIAGGIVLVMLAIGLAGAIFQTGYLAGVAVDGGGPVVVGPGYGWGFGGGPFHLLGTIFFVVLFVVLFVGLIRATFGGGHRREWGGGPRGAWGPGGHDGGHRFGSWEDRAREAHDEWHRRGASGDAGTSTSSGGTSPAGTPPGGAA